MNDKGTLRGIIKSMRLFQWIKNLSVLAAIIFSGKLFDITYLNKATIAFFAFCFLSSSSYLINDIVDAPYDRYHPQKRNRPIARGDVTPKQAMLAALVLGILSFVLASTLNTAFVVVLIIFFLVHMIYSFFLKKVAVLDILAISASFILRAFAGELATGYHLSVWLTFTVVFLSLFIASGKRRSELVLEGSKTRPSLAKYKKSLLDFYTSLFSVSTLISYSLFTYLERPEFGHPKVRNFLLANMPALIGRKWLMLTIFPVIFGIMRYSQLIIERKRGQRPEKVLASDIPLLITVFSWGVMLILILYVL